MLLRSLLATVLAAPFTLSAYASSPAPRVVGGENVTIAEFPWQAAIVSDTSDIYGSQFCAGAIVSDTWILTAAHCYDDGSTAVVVGIGDLNDTENAQVLPVKQWIVHESFVDLGTETRSEIELDNDIALIELETPIDFAACGERCRKIQIVGSTSFSSVAAPGTSVLLAGWGSMTSTTSTDPSEFPLILQKASLSVMDCTASPSILEASSISANMFCAGVADFSKDACSGDSGGALVAPNTLGTGYVQIGIVSWGTGRAEYGYPGVYTKISQYTAWISEKTSGSVQILEDDATTDPVDPVDPPAPETVSGGGGGGGSIGWYVLSVVALLSRRRQPQ